MLEHSLILQLSTSSLAKDTTSHLRLEYLALQKLFQAQSGVQQQYFRNQAATLTDDILNGAILIRFSIPESVTCLPMMDCSGVEVITPPSARHQQVGSILSKLTHPDVVMAFERRLSELEKSTSQAISISAGLIRYSVAVHIISHLLPAGNAVVYADPEDDDIPNQPIGKNTPVVLDHPGYPECEDEEKALPELHHSAGQNHNYANSLFLPQYVAFDDQNQLLVADLDEATARFQATRRYLLALNTAISLAPYMVVIEEFQAKRYGILGQLVNQGRALANYQVKLMCQAIIRRSENHSLDRGLSLTLPYFNDQTLTVENYKFDIIPGGRVMFVPAFVVLAVRAEAKKILLNTRLSLSTRKSLLQELCILERAFLR